MSSNGTVIRPRLLLTQGDAAGIGPEILAKAWQAGAAAPVAGAG